MAYTKTTWVNNSSPYINADNLNKIENQLETNTNDIETNTNDIETNTTNIQTNTENITNITGTILWTNQNPTNDFSQQTITLSSSDYDCYEIIYRQNTTTSRILNTGKIIKGYGTLLMQSIGQNQFRTINYVSDTSLEIYDNQELTTYGTTTTNDNRINIPLYVIGYKTGLFE